MQDGWDGLLGEMERLIDGWGMQVDIISPAGSAFRGHVFLDIYQCDMCPAAETNLGTLCMGYM